MINWWDLSKWEEVVSLCHLIDKIKMNFLILWLNCQVSMVDKKVSKDIWLRVTCTQEVTSSLPIKGTPCFIGLQFNAMSTYHIFLEIEGLWQPCTNQVYCYHFPKSICSLWCSFCVPLTISQTTSLLLYLEYWIEFSGWKTGCNQRSLMLLL